MTDNPAQHADAVRLLSDPGYDIVDEVEGEPYYSEAYVKSLNATIVRLKMALKAAGVPVGIIDMIAHNDGADHEV